MKPHDKMDHPQGLNPEDRAEWHRLCDRLCELHRKMPESHLERKLIGGIDKKEGNIVLMIFNGTLDDLIALREKLYED